jgi:ketosteroid isomerase-like protein
MNLVQKLFNKAYTGFIPFQKATHMNPDATKIILELDERWNEAYRQKNVSELETILADDWIAFTAQGTVTKTQILEAVPNNPEATLEFTRLELRIYGETAITRGRLQISTTSETRAQSFMRVYAKRSKQWQAVAVQVVLESIGGD